MFTLKRTEPKPTPLDDAIDNLTAELAGHDGESEEAAAIVANIKLLCEANAAVKTATKPDTVSYETLAMIVGNLAGIAMILSYEHVNVITSKAVNFVLKSKV